MKYITIKNEPTCGFIDDMKATGFSITYDDEETEATIFDLDGSKESSKLIEKQPVVEFWEKFQEINLQKVLIENEPDQGCDGSWSIVELSVGLQALTLRLWQPDLEYYKKSNLTESYKLLILVNDLIKFVKKHNFATDFIF